MQAPAAAEFVARAANGNMFEIQSSQAALEKTQNGQVRQFAQKMVQDHTGAGDRLKAAAQGQTVPTDLDQQHAQMLQQLQGASGPDFDRRYVQLQLAAHQDSVVLFERYGQNGDNPQLKQFAQQMLPDLQAHLQQIQQIRSALPPEPVAQGQSGSQQVAQAPAAPMTAPAGATGGQVLTTMQPGQWRVSKLIGTNIYGFDQNNRNDTDKIGDINEVIVDRTGNIQAVIVGVGGFLGIGEKDVAIPFNSIEWRTSEEVRTSTNTTAPATSAGTAARTDAPATGTTATAPVSRSGDTTTTGTVMRSDQAGANQGSPDRGYIRMTKADLQNAPTFRYDARDASRSTQPGSTTAPASPTAPATRP
jgi:predicted outer membrane protein